MINTVEQMRVESQSIAVIRCQATLQQLSAVVPEECGVVWNFLKSAGIRADRNLAVYLDDVINLEVGLEVDGPFASDGKVILSATPAGSVLTTAYFGPYDQLSEAHNAIRNWSARNYLALAGPNWEIYGHWTDDPSQLRTDVFYLLKGR